MTRGQESLVMDVVEAAATPGAATEAVHGELDLVVVPASEEELAAHARQLEEIDKASGGACIWKRLEAGKA